LTSKPEIRTKRLLITPFREKHLTQRYVGWLNDPDLMRYSENRHKDHTLASCHAYWKSFDGTPNIFWAIEEVETGNSHIGTINAYIDKNNLLADIGILIGEKKAQNKRYGVEVWSGVCEYLFRETGIRKLSAGTMSVNVPMVKLMHSVGMVNDGVRKKHYLFNGKQVDILYLAFFREQWDEKRLILKGKGYLI